MLREVHVREILPKKAKKHPLRGNRSEAALTTTTEKRWGMKGDVSGVPRHSWKWITMPTNAQQKSISVGTPQRSSVPCTRRGNIQTTCAWLSRRHLNQLPLFVVRSANKRGGDENICVYYSRLLAKGEPFSLIADSHLYFLDAMLPGPPELPDERASFDDSFDMTYRVNETLAQK